MSEPTGNRPDKASQSSDSDPLELIRESLDRLRFGAIQLTVHEGKLVQIEITEKCRFA